MQFFAYASLNENTTAMHLFWGIGWLGLGIIILQTLFGMVMGHHGDIGGSDGDSGAVDMQGGHGGGTDLVSIRSIATMLFGFGFGGAIFYKNDFSLGFSACGGIVIGLALAALYIALMNSLYRLRSDGTAVLSEAIDRSGTVYMRIPGKMSGSGEIQVSFGGRMQNIKAYTQGFEISTGATVRVIALHGDQALIVEKL